MRPNTDKRRLTLELKRMQMHRYHKRRALHWLPAATRTRAASSYRRRKRPLKNNSRNVMASREFRDASMVNSNSTNHAKNSDADLVTGRLGGARTHVAITGVVANRHRHFPSTNFARTRTKNWKVSHSRHSAGVGRHKQEATGVNSSAGWEGKA
eukprot:GHVT01011801.1.p1 GENE.GHVT01011801.1~~GHVT01011801.1.p1  ORF type:complete len:154 (+),score=8.99 GHVT01011801.1:604-1065(+)